MNRDQFLHYTTGVIGMDLEHWAMLSSLNLITPALPNNEASWVIDRLLQALIEHTIAEEMTMTEIHFPFTESHKDAHKQLILKFGSLKRKFLEDPLCDTTMLKTEFELTYVDHIKTHDSEYGIWARNASPEKHHLQPHLFVEIRATSSALDKI